jgi:flavin-dependent dehydrogenase
MNNIKSARSIKIAGGGIAGLSAAIKLKLNGFDPIIYEKEDKIGLGRHDDFEGIENWIFSNEMQPFFKKIGFDFNKIDSYPISRFTIHTISKEPFTIFQNKPFFYMIKRGSSYNSLDTQLFNQCAEEGVKFNFGQMAPNDCEIIATGTSKAAAYVRGINFKTKLKDQVHLLLGNKFASKGYAYLIIINGEGTLATAYKKTKNYQIDPIKNCIKYFNSIGIEIPDGNFFASRGSFSLPFGKLKSPFKIGEAGGYQDYLFGFGIRMSMLSGMAAALKIIGENSKAKRIINSLNQKRRLSFINRILYEKLDDTQMEMMAHKILMSNDAVKILSGVYSWNVKNLLRWISFKNQYEVRIS